MIILEVLGILAEGAVDYVKESVIEAPFKVIGAVEKVKSNRNAGTIDRKGKNKRKQLFDAVLKRRP